MEPGKEMDKLVVKKFLKWTHDGEYWNHGLYIPKEEVPKFSTSIVGANLVLDKLAKEHDQVDVFWDFGAWFCYTCDHVGGKEEWVYNRSTIGVETKEEAICRCALVCAGMDPEDI